MAVLDPEEGFGATLGQTVCRLRDMIDRARSVCHHEPERLTAAGSKRSFDRISMLGAVDTTDAVAKGI